MAKLYMLIGMPATGKSTYTANFVKENKRTIIVSTDSIRETVIGDVNRQDQNPLVFKLANHMIRLALKEGTDVIFDACNVWEDKRRQFINILRGEVENLEVIGIYFASTIDAARERNEFRSRVVPDAAMLRIAKAADFPTLRDMDYLDEIQYHSIERTRDTGFDELLNVKSYEEFDAIMEKYIEDYSSIKDLAQDCPYHTLSVSRHTYKAFQYAQKHMPKELEEYRAHILYALAFHDIGKALTKEFRRNSIFAHFTGHEKVSTQIFVAEAMKHDCLGANTSIDAEMIAALIKEHCFPYKEKDESKYVAALQDICAIYGYDFRDCLVFLRECDQAAH